jgi:hypothetical protein
VLINANNDIYVLQPFPVAAGYVLLVDSLRQMNALYENCEQRVAIYDSLNVVNSRIISNTSQLSETYKEAYDKERFWSRIKDVIWGAGLLTAIILLI